MTVPLSRGRAAWQLALELGIDVANMYQGCIDGVNNFDPWSSGG